ncbi:ribonuclease HII [Geotalea daltonii FRC-32]|uniref:Ribonuclease HII n=1 Tax=Geotalea daltonii (strain DSM 22248 / JCM 15807 / FRC-32) TaxID=316067 RepID=RNH2_GEODF|nr:ribonuclease HII [Geotalea daltonii]B9M597.1 RecName: Full=Ribonuclease HII; Short=RNase HII [Geotalea daltonii FRC-32]ACM19852.1 ribonuclease HII [Geotalea daltonii FRC-32]
MSSLDLFHYEKPTLLEFDSMVRCQGYASLAGVDEAGRGPLAGPVVAAAVILPAGIGLSEVDDSKKLTSGKRDELFEVIMANALAVGVGLSDAGVIDRINILQATLAAMKEALSLLFIKPDYVLVDGISKIPVTIPQKTIKKGDGTSLSIAAASIVAKVHRDRLMVSYDAEFPQYGFAAHKGYGCVDHLKAIAEYGPCPIHRMTFSGVKEHVKNCEG